MVRCFGLALGRSALSDFLTEDPVPGKALHQEHPGLGQRKFSQGSSRNQPLTHFLAVLSCSSSTNAVWGIGG